MARFGRSKTDDSQAEAQTYGEAAREDYETYGNPLDSENPHVNDAPEAPSQTVANLATLDVEESDAFPKRTRTTKANPFAAHVKRSLDSGKALKVTAPDKAAADEVEGMLRRAANNAEHGIDVRKVQNENGSYAVHFKSNRDKRSRAYTVEDVREWAKTQGYPDTQLYPRVHKDVSTEYRKAHGHKVPKSK